MEGKFNSGIKSKDTLYQKLVVKLQENGYKYSVKEVSSKFRNLKLTYTRNKRKSRTTGESAISWPYFNDFDIVFGNRSSIIPNITNLDDSLNYNASTESNNVKNNISGDIIVNTPSTSFKNSIERPINISKRQKTRNSSNDTLNDFKKMMNEFTKTNNELINKCLADKNEIDSFLKNHLKSSLEIQKQILDEIKKK